MKDHKTIIAVKIRGSQTMRDLWSLTKIFLALAVIFFSIGAVQVGLCAKASPGKWSVFGCLTPLFKEAGLE